MAITGAGTQANPYVIYNADDYNSFLLDKTIATSKYWGKTGIYVELGGDIDFSGKTFHFHLLNEGTLTFNGVFDGKGYSIKNIVLEENYTGSFSRTFYPLPNTTNMRFFSVIKTGKGCTLKNTFFYNISITALKHWTSINSIIDATSTIINNVYLRKMKANITSFTPIKIQGYDSRVRNAVIENVEHRFEATHTNVVLFAPIYYVQGGGTLTENMLENIIVYNFHSDIVDTATSYVYSNSSLVRLEDYSGWCKNYYININDRNRDYANYMAVGYGSLFPFKNTVSIETEEFGDSSKFSLPTDTWGFNDTTPYLLMFEEEVSMLDEEEEAEAIEAEKVLVEVLSTVSNIVAGVSTDFRGVKKLVVDVPSYAQPIQSSNNRTAKVNVNVLSYARSLSTNNITIEKKVKKIVNTVNSSVGAMSSSTELIRIKRKQIQVVSSIRSISTSALTMSKGSVSQTIQVTSSIQPVRSTSLYSKKKTMNTQSTLGVMGASVYATFGQIKLVNVKTWGQKFTSKVSSKHIKYVPPKPIEVNVELSYSINKSTLLVEHHRTTLEVEYHKSILRHNGGD